MALVSIVVPVYYNAPILPGLANRLSSLAAANTKHQFEFIYVDDGSGDDSFDTLKQMAEKDERVRLVKLVRNFGSNTAILAGMTYASGDCVGFIAADLQDPPETFAEMLVQWEAGYKVVLAVRKDRRGDPWPTRFLATVFSWLFKKVVFDEFSQEGIGFFLVDRQVVNFLVQCDEKNAHVIGLILWSGFHRKFVEYDRTERKQGKSRWTFGRKLKYFVDAFAAFSYLPLRLASALGLILSGIGFLYALFILVARLLGKIQVEGWAALIIIVLLTAGVQLILLGVLGEYLWRTLDASRHRPTFIVEQLINFPVNK